MEVNGTYSIVPLSKESLSITVMQTRVRPWTQRTRSLAVARTSSTCSDLIDNTQNYGPAKDLLQFHEFPITGFRFEWIAPTC